MPNDAKSKKRKSERYACSDRQQPCQYCVDTRIQIERMKAKIEGFIAGIAVGVALVGVVLQAFFEKVHANKSTFTLHMI